MSHQAQVKFCKQVKKLFPAHFKKVNVIDVGSLDVNGNNRRFFSNSHYIGVDLYNGRNVDVVGKAHEVLPKLQPKKSVHACWNSFLKRIELSGQFDTIISTEALEHDIDMIWTLSAMYNKLKPGGLLLITCAGEGRAEHGTSKVKPEDSPGTNDFYENVTNSRFSSILEPCSFHHYFLRQVNGDLQFYGIKA